MDDADAVIALHEQTKHGGLHDRSRLVRFRPLDPSNRPEPFKRYRGLQTVALPRDVGGSDQPAGRVLSGHASSDPADLDARLLARLLFWAAGVTRVSPYRGASAATWFRAAMSAGNLHPVEVYAICRAVGGLEDGVYHFAPLEFALTRLRAGLREGSSPVRGATLLLAGIPWRTGWKYGERGYRHLWWDAGALTANLLCVADAAGVPARARLGFDDAAAARLAGIDGVTELPLALVDLGGPASVTAPLPDLAPLDLEVEPLAPRPLSFPLVLEAHRSGDLTGPSEVARWQRDAAAFECVRAARVSLSSIPRSTGTPVEEVIRRRGSTRLMVRQTARSESITWGLPVASRAQPWDAAAPGGTLVDHNIALHSVEGLEAGAYRSASGELYQTGRGEARQLAAHLCLDQALGGDSAFTTFHCTNLGAVVGALGPRGYRAAHFEAGLAAGRLQLAAFALGLGATGLTFLDDEVSRAFDTDESCLLVTSVGTPAYRSVPGGAPGEPADLVRFDRLMARLGVL